MNIHALAESRKEIARLRKALEQIAAYDCFEVATIDEVRTIFCSLGNETGCEGCASCDARSALSGKDGE